MTGARTVYRVTGPCGHIVDVMSAERAERLSRAGLRVTARTHGGRDE